jgi:TrpR family trp operon transcriptional repressor
MKIEQFFHLCQEAESIGKVSELFRLFFTKEEIAMLESRCKCVQSLLQTDMTQREIAKKHHISIAQITRGSNELKSISSPLRKLLSTFRW